MTRGEIWWADLGLPFGSEPAFKRPVLIVQDNAFNSSKISTTIVLSLTTNIDLAEAPGNVFLSKKETKLPKDSVVNVSQIATIDRNRLLEKVSKLSSEKVSDIDSGLCLVLNL
jgi:mRNA interferase MazF